MCQVPASGARTFTLSRVAELRPTPVGATHTPVGRWGGNGSVPRKSMQKLAPPHRGQVPKIILVSPGTKPATGRALSEQVPTFEENNHHISYRAGLAQNLRRGPAQSPIPFRAKLRPTEPPFLESTRMCKRARATRALREAAAEHLSPAAPNPDFRSPTFAPFLFALSFGESTEPPSSGRSLPVRPRFAPPPTSPFFPPCPAAGPGRGEWRSQKPLRRRLCPFHAVAGLRDRDASSARCE